MRSPRSAGAGLGLLLLTANPAAGLLPRLAPAARLHLPRIFGDHMVLHRDRRIPLFDWAELRDAQAAALALPRTGMATGIDLGEPHDIHPKNKAEVGRRLALLARARVYGERDLVCTGPIFAGMERRGAELVLRFRSIGSGLVARRFPLTGFEIAGKDRRWRQADARIEGHEVVLRAEGLAHPVHARYLWANAPEASLYNAEGLPAYPFRTER